ncbi:hypothetical protein CRUP_001131 [Coryphaenoides rupestris]|nr:hypothetical protein CRUP_001131 [Coryphaenoides rupestris]
MLDSLPDASQEEVVRTEGTESENKPSDHTSHPEVELADLAINTGETEVLSDIFGLDLRREGGQYKITPHDPNASLTQLLHSSSPPAPVPSPELRQRHQSSGLEESEGTAETSRESKKTGAEIDSKDKGKKKMMAKQKIRQSYISKCEEPDLQESAFWKKIIAYQRKLLNYFARNFYNMRMLALFVAFAINFILLFYKVKASLLMLLLPEETL